MAKPKPWGDRVAQALSKLVPLGLALLCLAAKDLERRRERVHLSKGSLAPQKGALDASGSATTFCAKPSAKVARRLLRALPGLQLRLRSLAA